jgi:hypothetical protein
MSPIQRFQQLILPQSPAHTKLLSKTQALLLLQIEFKVSAHKIKIMCSYFTYVDICSLRLDLETFSITGPRGSDELDGGLCSIDSFKATGLRFAANSVPTICGENSGMHSKY